MSIELKYFLYSSKVLPEHIDPNNHLNNIIYLQWMQEAAIEHVKANGVFELTESQGLIPIPIQIHTFSLCISRLF